VTRTLVVVVALLAALLVGAVPAIAAAPAKKAKPPPKPSLALLPLEGLLPEKDLRAVEDELRKALPSMQYVVQKRDRTRQTLADMYALGIRCDTGTVDCLVQVGGLAGVNVMLRGGLTSVDASSDQLELLGVDVNGLKERGRVKVVVPRADPTARAKSIQSALVGVLRPETWRGQLRVSAKQANASIYVDGYPRGFTPKAEPIELTPGEHEIFVGLEAHRAFKQKLVVPFDDEVVVEVALEPGVAEPPPKPATAQPTTAAPSPPTPPPSRKTPLRVVVYDVEATGVEPRIARVMGQLLVDEIRKRERVSVLDSGELRALVGDGKTTARDFRGCSAAECFAEVAEALGADAVVASQLTQVGGNILFGLRRIDPAKQEVAATFSEQVPLDDTDKLLPLVGKSIEVAFAEVPLRKGQKAGVDVVASKRLNPPPLAPIYATSVCAGAAVVGVFGVGSLAGALVAGSLYDAGLPPETDAESKVPPPPSGPIVRNKSGSLNEQRQAVEVLVPLGVIGVVVGGVAGAAGAVLAGFTDWDGYRTQEVE
jgi:hypothetical protein